MIVSPKELKGRRIQEYMDNGVNWTDSLREAVQAQLTIGPHDPLCRIEGVNDDQLYEAMYNGGPSATYPAIDKVYEPIDECLLQGNSNLQRSGMEVFLTTGHTRSRIYAM